MENKRTTLKKTPSAGYGSNAHIKVTGSQGHTTLINQQASSQYNSRQKATPVAKPSSKIQGSRNQGQSEQEQTQLSTRTLQVQGKQTQSQLLLQDYGQQHQHQRLTTEEAEDLKNDSLYNVNGVKKQLKKNHTVRQLKSPSPKRMEKQMLAATKQETVHSNPHSTKVKVSLNKRIRVTRTEAVIPPTHLNLVMKGSMVSSDGEKSAPQAKKLLQHSAKPASKQISNSRYRPTGKEVAEAQRNIKINKLYQLSMPDKDPKNTDTVQSPSIVQSFGSPRIGNIIGNSTMGMSSQYSVAGDSIMINTSSNQFSNGRKLCLSEKIAPKGKKPKKNGQKQPKQISISREQIIIQEQHQPVIVQPPMINYQKYLAPQNNQRMEAQIFNQPNNVLRDFLTHQFYHQQQLDIQADIEDSQERLTRLERNHNMERIEKMKRAEKSFEQQPERSSKPAAKDSVYIQKLEAQHTPIATFEEDQDTPHVQEYTKESFSKQLTLNNQQENGPGIFSFHAYPQLSSQKLSAPSDSEDAKEVTGIFGAQVETLGNENLVRISTEGGLSDKKKIVEIPTPVFQTENRRNQSFLKSSESMVKIEINHNELSQKVVLNTAKVDSELKALKQKETHTQILNPSSKNGKDEEKKERRKDDDMIFKTPELLNYDSGKTTVIEMDKTMKKVHSTNDLGLRKALLSNQLNNSNHSSQNSQGSFFSRIKSYFKFGQANPQQMEHETMMEHLQYEQQYRCNCGPSGKIYACSRGIKWLSSLTSYNEKEYEKNKTLYEGLIEMKTQSGSETQIERDIPRTFPNSDPFMNSYEGQQQLQRVLNAFSKYDTSIGYVQGMNFIVGALLQHCSEDIAFWLFVTLIEDFEMRDIYQPRLPGLYKHSQIIELLQIEHMRDLHNHFCLHNILIEMYASDWIFCLFSNIIPVKEYHFFLDQFFEGGWMFFYKFALSFMKALAPELIEYNDISEILTIIKLKHTKKDSMIPSIPSVENTYLSSVDNQSSRKLGDSISPNRKMSAHRPGNNSQIQFQVKNMINRLIWKEERFNSESFKDDTIWEKLVEISCKEWQEDFNEDFVSNLLQNFDSEKLVFKQTEVMTPRNETMPASPPKTKVIQMREAPVNIIQMNRVPKIPIIPVDNTNPRERGQSYSNDNRYQMYLSDSASKHRVMHSDIQKMIQVSDKTAVAPNFVKKASQQSQGKVATAKIYLVGSPSSAIAEKRGSLTRKLY